MAFLSTADLDRLIALTQNADALQILQSAKEGIADPELREHANDTYGSDDIEIDDEPATSIADDGTWVAAWVWIANQDEEEE